MGHQQLKHTKQKSLSNRVDFHVLPMIIMVVILNSCAVRDGTYYEYLTEAPIITTDKELAMQKHIVATKEQNDTICYYYTEIALSQTKDYEKAKKGYITTIKNLKNGKAIGQQVCLDGFGDTIIVDYYDINHLDSLHISYYGEKKMKFYQELKNGRKHGTSKSFYPNGNLQQSTNWKDGYLHGEEINCYQNEQIQSRGNNQNGVKSGLWVYLNEQGDTIRTERYNLGKLDIQNPKE